MNSLQITFVTMAASLGIAMQNASTNQRSGQIIATASLAQSCRLILSKASKGG
jgi:hypothetical protein